MFSSSVADAPLIREPLHAPVAHLIRGGVVEGIHYGSVVVLGTDGKVDFQLGDIEAAFYPRSALKPVQAVAMVRAGLPLGGELLSLTAASHSGEERHLAGTRRILELAGLTEDHLRNVPDLPFDPVVRDTWVREGPAALPGSPRTAPASTRRCCTRACSTTGRWRGISTPRTRCSRRSPRSSRTSPGSGIARVTVDGCGAPLFSVSLHGLARAAARVTTAAPGTPEARVADAMRAHLPRWPPVRAGTSPR